MIDVNTAYIDLKSVFKCDKFKLGVMTFNVIICLLFGTGRGTSL